MYRVVDSSVISESEYTYRASDILDHLKQRSEAKLPVAALALSQGRELSGSLPEPIGGARLLRGGGGFTPIGPNLPLTVMIRHVYTGKYPERGPFQHRGDMAIVSGVKNFSVSDATSRALNYLQSEVAPNTHFIAPDTFAQGTPLVLYSPAVTTAAITMSVEMATANTFAQDLLAQIANGFQTLAGIPILLPYAGYLLGGGSLLKLGSNVVGALYQPRPAFLRTEMLNMSLPGSPYATADFRIICNNSLAADQFNYIDGVGLVDKDNKPYAGDEPYVVISLDGAKNDELKGFTPTVASAAVMQKFFQIADKSQTIIQDFTSGISLYNDLQYRLQADKLQNEISQTKDPTEIATLTAQRQAVIKNILDEHMRPTA